MFKILKRFALAIIVFAVLALLPLLVNRLLITDFPFIPQIADGVWVGFWGSYIGALVTLMCLLLTIAYNKHTIRLDVEYKRKEEKKRDVISRIGRLNLTEYLEKPLAYIDNLDVNEQSLYLLKISKEYQSEINTADLTYNTADASEQQIAFYKAYTNCLTSCIGAISLTMNKMNKENPSKGIKEIALLAICSSASSFSTVKDAAQTYMKEIEDNYKSMSRMGCWSIIKSMYNQ